MADDNNRIVLNRYELQSQIARGGTARVYLAKDLKLDRKVAVKMLFPELSVDSSFVERFRREAQAAANLNHPNIVSVYDWGEFENTYFIVMEYVDGRSLSSKLRSEGHIPVSDAAFIGSAVASALAYAHSHGVIHRDIKPGNVLITSDNRVKVTDFGIARATGVDENLTQTGLVMGTATYFSPEQAQGHGSDGRSDIYSLGVVLYEMVSGRPPFTGDTPVAIALKHVKDDMPPLKSLVPDVPESYEAIVNKAMSKNADLRYVSAGELGDDLDRFRLGKPVAAYDATTAVSQVNGDGGLTSVVSAVGEYEEGRPARRPIRVETAPPKSKTPIYAAAIAACLLIFALLVYVGGRNLGYFGAPQSFAVPKVTNLPLTQAEQDLGAVGLNYTIKRYFNDSVPGTVFNQSPISSKVSKGDTVILEVSKGAPTQLVPPVDFKQLVQAETILTKAGFKVTAQGIASSAPAYQVTNQFPKAGASLSQGGTVTITYSDPSASVVVPNLTGVTQSAAVYQLGKDNLAVGTITQQASTSIPQGSVISTQPAPNSTVDTNTPINLVISSGPSSVTMPLVVGDTQTVAQTELQGSPYNFSITIVDEVTCSADYGLVVTQNPSGGVTAAPGQSVTLFVGVSPTTTTTSSVVSTSSPTTTTTTSTTSTTSGTSGSNSFCPYV